MTVLLSASGVHKSYQHADSSPIDVLQGVDLDLQTGEFIAVIGPSGSGKSSLMRCLSGLEAIDQGSILFDGVDLTKLSHRSESRIRAARMSFVFQQRNLLAALTALENVELPLKALRIEGATDRAIEALTKVGLADRLQHRPDLLSGGQRQRVALARAMACQPSIIWADEPTGQLDGETSERVVDMLCLVRETAGCALLVVTHDMSLAERADRTLVLDGGQLRPSVMH